MGYAKCQRACRHISRQKRQGKKNTKYHHHPRYHRLRGEYHHPIPQRSATTRNIATGIARHQFSPNDNQSNIQERSVAFLWGTRLSVSSVALQMWGVRLFFSLLDVDGVCVSVCSKVWMRRWMPTEQNNNAPLGNTGVVMPPHLVVAIITLSSFPSVDGGSVALVSLYLFASTMHEEGPRFFFFFTTYQYQQ